MRVAQIGLFMLASPEDDALRHSVLGLAASTAIAVALLAIASLFDGLAQGALWLLALVLDMGGPYLFGSAGWKLVPGHFAERHGLIVIIALGESIVAIGVGASDDLTLGIGTAAVLGVALAAAMWWVYFDIVAIVSARRLVEAEPGKVQNEMARDSYSYVHLAMVAGIVLTALGLKTTIGHFDDHLHTVPAFALLGGVAIYLLGLVALPLPPRAHAQPPAARPRRRPADPGPGRDRDPGAGRGRRPQRPALGDDRLRDPPLRRRAHEVRRPERRPRPGRLGAGPGRSNSCSSAGDREAERRRSASPSWRPRR